MYDPTTGRWLSVDPLSFKAGDANLYRYCGNDPVNHVDPSGFYGEDVHFYFNYYLARYLGFSQPTESFKLYDKDSPNGYPATEAYVIAWMATRVDYAINTRPVDPKERHTRHKRDLYAAEIRHRFHFPERGNYKGVKAGDSRVRSALWIAANEEKDIVLFGVLLHVYQDTFSHQSYGDVRGHVRV